MTDRTRSVRAKQPGPANKATEASESPAGNAADVASVPHRPVAPRKSRRAVAPDAGSPNPVQEIPLTAPAPVAPSSHPAVPRRGPSVETVLYLALMAIAILTRFWNLGAKALHHDESLHAYYSWVLETGGGYRHHPLMHGPFLFHANALVYLLFGDSDASSRYMPAFFGVVLVALPYLLRLPNLLGRWGALAASFLFLISPVLLYQSRYIRHDIYSVAGTLLLFIAIVRYWDRPERRWLVIGAGSIAFLLTNHEIVFAILAIFGAYIYGAVTLGLARGWWQTRRDLVYRFAGVHAGAIGLILAVVLFTSRAYRDRIYDIPWENPTTQQQVDYFKDLITNPLVLSLLAISLSFVAGMWLTFNSARNPERKHEGWLTSVFGDPEPRTAEGGLVHALRDRNGLAIAFLVALFIFVTFFTSLYTNLYGLVSSTIATDGTLLYWLGQHDYRRGEQPWFYFLLLFPQYEFIAVLFGSAMAGLTVVRGFGGLFGWTQPGRNLFVRMLLTVWLGGILAGLSYAGEKMPWLVSHITLPATLLAAAMIGGLTERAIAARQARREGGRYAPGAFAWPEWALVTLLVLAAGSWFALAALLSHGRFVSATHAGRWTRTITSYGADRWWWLAIPPVIAALGVGLSALLRGSRRAGLATLISVCSVLTLLQVHSSWSLSYENPDVPTEMMIYTQTSPDVTRIMDEITRLSYEHTGGTGLEVWYDSGVSWPMQWYLRDFENKRFVGSQIAGPPDDAAVVIVSTQYDASFAPYLAGYTAQEYVLRWWFPEEIYRDFAIAPEISPGRSAWKSGEDPAGFGAIAGSILDSFESQLSPDGQAHLFRLLVYRDLEQPIGRYNFKIYVRNDLLPLLNSIRY